MNKNLKHIAIIPARKNSKGLKNKNRKLFENTAKFLKKISFFNQVIVASDDNQIEKKTKKNNFIFFKRSKKNAADNSSIKSLMIEVAQKRNLKKDTVVWLIYLTLPIKRIKDFKYAYKITKKKKFLSLICFRKVLTHPFDCWIINKKLKKFIKNDVFRRQDKPEMYEHHHYLCAFRVNELKKLNSELINQNTTPIIMAEGNNFLEIDTKQDYKNYLKIRKNLS